jgi:hypothetical protein
MKARYLAAAAAFAVSSVAAAPLLAQDFPMRMGDYVEMTSVTLDDGHNLDYAQFLAGQWRDQEEFAKSQGWITGYEILANVNKRAGEPDLYLVVRYKSLPDAMEMEKREAVIKSHVRKSDAQMEAESGDRAKYRHVNGSQLLQVLAFK